ncbi:FAD-dependent oxidoreductase [Mycobacterium avium]|uniref:FAD-binding oxidoreductase n=1 Tax=Mycobacterium avium subsp. hominissuis TaxID=439334 RepID=A0A3B6XBN7_MYCAV|nr:FAD-dependent oxidoreductase [Mycobacterium avium]APT11229.1 amino acid oxidase [Mycobacterium avium subsp. hominissuis]AXO23869.1 FAD-binding oxidoreductase [Mycobacterium avium subsp. hominissuis]ETZ43431.1 FAD dependent oxidoreductase family protein [Mycobacterium avium MAV_120809_2495]MCA2338143.1 FAD-dependent oxidoreductase [Mycobacterium avium]MCA4728740.1 FAD-dependent oxidoreductase [Mycobacterium avium subsp. hominissuis]
MSSLSQPKVLVIGAGVNGWTTALVLARRGWRVVVVADRFGIDTVATVAGVLWEWPPSVADCPRNQTAPARAAAWAKRSYIRFGHLAADPRTRIGMRPAVFYFSSRIEDDPAQHAKMLAMQQFVSGYVHDPALIDSHGVNPDAGVVDAYSHLAPTIDTDWYLAWLTREAELAGVTAVQLRIHGPLIEQEQRLRAEYGADVIVNCTGLGARELADDPTIDSHRGALLRIVDDGTSSSRVTAAHVMATNPNSDTQNRIFIVPRGVDRLLLGGLVEPGQYDTDLNLANHPPLQEMLDRCTEFLPKLRGTQLDDLDPVRVGLRPVRPGGVRVETQPGTPIVHNYGHGGAGVTLSWGCAHEVADLAYEALANRLSH